ncbi:MAG TPA: ABC transporter permease subunit [Chloroflexia bacterium]|nr:ABC transporter permease subunit [Chloroflexia bacterium]
MAVTTAPAGKVKKAKAYQQEEKKLPLGKQIIYQILCLLITFTVLFPIFWVVSISISPLSDARPKDLIPKNASFDAYRRVWEQPTSNPISFPELAFNSFKLAAGTSLFAVFIGVSAAYAFSRFKFRGRGALMLAVLGVLMLPNVATLAPLFTLLNRVQLGDFNLRNSLWGVGLAVVSGALPFAIWNLKGYLDTIPIDLEEAASIDGATRNQVFLRIVLPLAVPALAVTAFLGFLGGWTEFFYSWQFLTNPKDFTLAMALSGMSGQYARTTPWAQFSAFAILVALPVAVVYLFLQKYIVGGLTVGGSKG